MRLETEPSAVSSLPFLEGLYVCFIRLVVFFDPISKCVNVFVWCDSIGGGLVISYQTWATISQLHTTGRANGQKQKKGKVHEKRSRRNFVSKAQQDALACETHFTSEAKNTRLFASAQGKSLPNMCNLAHFRTVCSLLRRSAELCNASYLRTSESDCKHGWAE